MGSSSRSWNCLKSSIRRCLMSHCRLGSRRGRGRPPSRDIRSVIGIHILKKKIKMTGGTPEVRFVKNNLIDFWHLVFDLIDFWHLTFDFIDFFTFNIWPYWFLTFEIWPYWFLTFDLIDFWHLTFDLIDFWHLTLLSFDIWHLTPSSAWLNVYMHFLIYFVKNQKRSNVKCQKSIR